MKCRFPSHIINLGYNPKEHRRGSEEEWGGVGRELEGVGRELNLFCLEEVAIWKKNYIFPRVSTRALISNSAERMGAYSKDGAYWVFL